MKILKFQVGDRLFSAFGQDTIDALFWTATEPRGRKREHIGVLAHFLLTIVYVILHTVLVLLQATTLNVAINASNKALLTIMMSNNVSIFDKDYYQLFVYLAYYLPVKVVMDRVPLNMKFEFWVPNCSIFITIG